MKRAALVLAGLLAITLQLTAIHSHSLSGDGAYHLLAGHQALRYGQNTVNYEHPPLVKLVVSLPLLLEDEPLEAPLDVDEALSRANLVYEKGELVRRATIRGRYVALVVFVLPFLAACYAVGRRFADRRTGIVLVLMTSLSLSILPYLTILQTDTAVSLAFLVTLLASASYLERPSWQRSSVLGLASGFALAVKFSGVLLGPTVFLAIMLAKTSWWRRLGSLAVVGGLAFLVLEASYLAANPRYDAETGRETIRIYCANKGTLAVDERMAPWQQRLLAVEHVDPRMAQWLTGFLGVRIQNAIGIYPSYAFGEVSSAGRWWYFPVVLAIKTPLAILVAALMGLVALFVGQAVSRGAPPAIWRETPDESAGAACPTREPPPVWVLPAVTVAVYFVASMTSNYNLSVRHMLPVLPLLYLPVARFMASRSWHAEILVAVLALESGMLAPLWMSSTNTWWLGPANPTRFALGAGNLEYRQNFLQLARYAEKHDLDPLWVAYPPLPDAVLRPYLPEARMARPGDELEPGWYAVNVTVEQLVPALLEAEAAEVYNYEELRRGAQAWRPFWQSIVKNGEDHGWVAGSFHLYRIPQPET